MNDVAAPLYRFFLADAQNAARDGDAARMRECLGLALDFVPEGQRERVLLAATELTSAAGTSPGAPARISSAPEVVVRLAPGASSRRTHTPTAPRPGRIVWEDQAPPPPASFAAVVPPRPRSRRVMGAAVVMAASAALAAAFLVASGLLPLPALVPGQHAGSRAAQALDRGDARLALEVLDSAGEDVPAPLWLLRARAHEGLADTSAAVRALSAAAARDSEGGHVALEASAHLARLHALQEAADASLYAVTPARTPAELEAIALMQERAGYGERARRVRQQ